MTAAEAQLAVIVAALRRAPSRQLSVRTLARKLGNTTAALHEALVLGRRQGVIERAYPALRESPSATTYRLTEDA